MMECLPSRVKTKGEGHAGTARRRGEGTGRLDGGIERQRRTRVRLDQPETNPSRVREVVDIRYGASETAGFDPRGARGQRSKEAEKIRHFSARVNRRAPGGHES